MVSNTQLKRRFRRLRRYAERCMDLAMRHPDGGYRFTVTVVPAYTRVSAEYNRRHRERQQAREVTQW